MHSVVQSVGCIQICVLDEYEDWVFQCSFLEIRFTKVTTQILIECT